MLLNKSNSSPKIEADNESFQSKYDDLTETLSSVDTLISQLSKDTYQCMSAYINNLQHLNHYQTKMNIILVSDKKFINWLKSYDLDLWINILSTRRTYILLNNMMNNLRLTTLKE